MILIWIKVSVQCASYGKVISHLRKISIVGKCFSFFQIERGRYVTELICKNLRVLFTFIGIVVAEKSCERY